MTNIKSVSQPSNTAYDLMINASINNLKDTTDTVENYSLYFNIR